MPTEGLPGPGPAQCLLLRCRATASWGPSPPGCGPRARTMSGWEGCKANSPRPSTLILPPAPSAPCASPGQTGGPEGTTPMSEGHPLPSPVPRRRNSAVHRLTRARNLARRSRSPGSSSQPRPASAETTDSGTGPHMPSQGPSSPRKADPCPVGTAPQRRQKWHLCAVCPSWADCSGKCKSSSIPLGGMSSEPP